MRNKLFGLVSLLIVLSMVLAACGPTATPETVEVEVIKTVEIIKEGETIIVTATPEPEVVAPAAEFKSKDPTTLVSVVFGEPETLDPALDYETAGGDILAAVYDTLITYDREKPTTFVPMLATEVPTVDNGGISADGLTYTFKIRSGVKFHDGSDMTPSDVAYSFQRGVLQGGSGSPQWLFVEPFFGIGLSDIAELVDDSGAMVDDPDALKAADPELLKAACEKVMAAVVADDAAGTVTFNLAVPWGPFIATLAPWWGGVMDKDWAAANGAWDGSCDTWQNYYAEPSETDPLTTIMNGTGPFKLESWTQGEELVLARNDNYWREPAKLERIVFKYIDEWGTRFAMVQAGDADMAAVPAENRSQVDAMVGVMRVFDLAAGVYGEEVEVCAYDPSKQGVEKFTPCAPGETGLGGPMRLYIGRPSLSSQDLFMTFNIAEKSNYVGSGQLDGNGIPLDFFSDVHIRRGFAYCFDWDIYISDVFDGEAVQQPVLARIGMPGYEADAPVFSYDPAQCEAEFKLADLDKDGIPAGDDPEGDVWTTGFRLQMAYNQGNNTRQTIVEILSSNLATVNELFQLETVGLPWATYLRVQRAYQLPLLTGGWQEDFHDPYNWYQPYTYGTYGGRQGLPDEVKDQFKALLIALGFSFSGIMVRSSSMISLLGVWR